MVTIEQTVHRPFVHRYESISGDITVPAALKSGLKIVDVLTKIDTGSTFCLFERHYGEALRRDVETSEEMWVRTLNGRFKVYGHEVSVAVFNVEHSAMVYFYEDYDFGRNVLGRRGWLDRVRLGLVDHDCELYLAAYND